MDIGRADRAQRRPAAADARAGADRPPPALPPAPPPAPPLPARARVGAAAPAALERRDAAPLTLRAMADPAVHAGFPRRLGSREQLSAFRERFGPEVHQLLMASYLSQLPDPAESSVFPVDTDAISRINITALRSAAAIPALATARCPEGYTEATMLAWCADRIEFAADLRSRVSDLLMQHRTSDDRMHALDPTVDAIRDQLGEHGEVLVRCGSNEHGILLELRTVDAGRAALSFFNSGFGLDRFHAEDPQRAGKFAQVRTSLVETGQLDACIEDIAYHALIQDEAGDVDALYGIAPKDAGTTLYAAQFQRVQKGKDCLDESINAYLKHRLGDLGYQAAKYTKLSSALEGLGQASQAGPVIPGSQFPSVALDGRLALHRPEQPADWTGRVASNLELRTYATGQRLMLAIDRAFGEDVRAPRDRRYPDGLAEQAALIARLLHHLAAVRGQPAAGADAGFG